MTEMLRDHTGGVEPLVSAVEAELLDLRSSYGVLSATKFAAATTLVRILGDDLLEALVNFEHELERYIFIGNREEAAAAISILAPAETVLDRLEYVVMRLPQDGKIRDQRTGRRWADEGIRIIAADLVYMSKVQDKLGVELVSIDTWGNRELGFQVDVRQLINKEPNFTGPQVRVWRFLPDAAFEGSPIESAVYLHELPTGEAGSEMYLKTHHRLHVEFPDETWSYKVDADDRLHRIEIELWGVRVRQVTFADGSDLDLGYQWRFTTYRQTATIELVASEPVPR